MRCHVSQGGISHLMSSQAEIIQAAAILREGGLVAFPTETVYGLGANAMNENAVRKIFAAKHRPWDHPLIVHLASLSQLADWASYVSPDALLLAQAFWPGPLTLILEKQPWVLDAVTGGQATVGLRMPKHPIAQALLQTFGGGVAAPSANQFTHLSPTTAVAVTSELGDQVDLILDGGACEGGIESTIFNMSGDQPVILRPGLITSLMIERVLGEPIAMKTQTPIRAPGMHALHYAPRTPTQLVETRDLCSLLQSLPAGTPVAVMVHSAVILPQLVTLTKVIMSEDASRYAHALYETLRKLDHQQFKKIIIEAVPNGELWDAIRDRLTKASHY